MVSIKQNNLYQLREHLISTARDKSYDDCLKIGWLEYMTIAHKESISRIEPETEFQKIALSGLTSNPNLCNRSDLTRLLGQEPTIDGIPLPWVQDVFGVFGVYLCIKQLDQESFRDRFLLWITKFLPNHVINPSIDDIERSVVNFLINTEKPEISSPIVKLLFHHKGIYPIEDSEILTKLNNELVIRSTDIGLSESTCQELAIHAFLIDKICIDQASLPSNNWSIDELLHFLESLTIGLKRWTWETSKRTPATAIEKWGVWHEYHVQNLLYFSLAPIFNNIDDEIYLEPLGQKTPRLDLYLPSIHTVIEVKYKKDNKKSWQSFLGEIAQDISLYRSDPKYKNCSLIVFFWDHSRSTQEHAKFKEGVMKMEGVQGCVVLCSPSFMNFSN